MHVTDQNNIGIDFLSAPSISRLRKEINNIVDSYSHPWDVVAELAQNSVDAIRHHRQLHGTGRAHAIDLTFDRESQTLTIRDTGTGI
jgi:HSP90 family molecular chaperone